jgi:hypothetical protein
MNLLFLDKHDQIIKYFIIIGWILCWLSLGFNPSLLNQLTNLNEFRFENLNFFKLIDTLRGICTLIIFPILLFIFIKLITQKKFLKSNFLFLVFFLFFLIQLLGLFVTENQKINIYYLINSINIIIICIIFKNFFSKKELITIFNINLIILVSIFIIFGSQYLTTYFQNTNLHFYDIWGNIKNNYGSFIETPRPTGLSRTALIILIISSFLLNKNNKYYYFYLTLTIICSFFIIILGSRTILLIYFLYIIFYFFYFKIKNIKKIFLTLSKFILIPVFFILVINQGIFFKKQEYPKKNFKSQNDTNIIRSYPKFNSHNLDNFSSGRLNDWKLILTKNNNIIYGNGVMGDRYLINQSASNLIIYAYASSGLFGVILIIYIYLNTIKSSISIMIRADRHYLKDYNIISSFCLFVLMLRSLLETSYGIFGIDLILYCFFMTIITFDNKE